MRAIRYSGRFKKDLKRYKNCKSKIRSLGTVLSYLEKTGRVPVEYNPHKLHGVYEGCIECHIESDFLLIWIDGKTGTIWLERLGTHHELFGL